MLFLALLLGLRHATDPDHLTAVALLVTESRRGARRAGALGLAWGAGHATTLIALGLPFVLLGPVLPESVQRLAEMTVGLVIAVLAARLLVRWARGVFHDHPHAHDGIIHAHPHAHEHDHDAAQATADAADAATPAHGHGHGRDFGRSPAAAYGVGLLHGIGGSAAAGLLVVAAAGTPSAAVAALAVFAAGTAISMAVASCLFALAVAPAARRLAALIPILGAAGLAFGLFYAAAAID